MPMVPVTGPSSETVLANFLYRKVQKAMRAMDWKWHLPRKRGRATYRVPTIAEMKKLAAEVMADLLSHPNVVKSVTGGFEAEHHNGQLYLRFVIQ